MISRPARLIPQGTTARLALLACALPVVALVVVGWSHRWTSDDAFINFRVVDHLLHGDGPVFNVGERVEAFTSPAWIALLAFFDFLLPFRLEWIAAIASLVLSAVGVAAGMRGAAVLWGLRGSEGLVVPLGAAVFVAVAPVWDFATSGLEVGLSFAWLGCSFLALAHVCAAPNGVSRIRLAVVAVLLGLGPLVRPDFVVFTVAFLVALVILEGRPVRTRSVTIIASGLALPLLYELWRMGYYASLVPNTALAKEAGASYWSQGILYLRDFIGPYDLWLPGAALLGLLVLLTRARFSGRQRLLVVILPVLGAALLEALFVVKVGGDFMHGRMLLPPFFAALMPVMVVRMPWRKVPVTLSIVVVVWAAVCAVALRTTYTGQGPLRPHQYIGDERAYYIWEAGGRAHPVTLDDYRGLSFLSAGERLRAMAAHQTTPDLTTLGVPSMILPAGTRKAERARADLPEKVIAPAANIGILGYAAGRDVWVVDMLGLGDPLASRVALTVRKRPGHEKLLPLPWVIARFGDGTAIRHDPSAGTARLTLDCSSDISRIVDGVQRPLNAGRFFSNLDVAISTYGFRIPPNPWVAHRSLCKTAADRLPAR